MQGKSNHEKGKGGGQRFDAGSRLIHLGLVISGITAWLTGDFAEGYGLDYWIHAGPGFLLTLFTVLRIVTGIAGPTEMRFTTWVPFTAAQWALIFDDLRELARRQIPHRRPHEGLAGLVQAFGLLLFIWMGISGVALFAVRVAAPSDVFYALEESHEIGEILIPLYLLIHAGSAVIHALRGRKLLKHMFFLD